MADAHRLSPSSWNRFETCPRMYWLSRQGLPRKAGMAASLGTAIHASIEDLLKATLAQEAVEREAKIAKAEAEEREERRKAPYPYVVY